MYLSILPYLIALHVMVFSPASETFRVRGTIVSSTTNKPIPFGVIYVSSTKGYKVDGSGKFTIDGLTMGKHKLSLSAFGYAKMDTTITIDDGDLIDFKWFVSADCQRYSRESALKQIKSKTATLLLQGGIAPVIYSSDQIFSDKYNIRFYDLGCVAYDPSECLIAYNETIFDYLDQKYSKAWRKEIRKDVIGLRQK